MAIDGLFDKLFRTKSLYKKGLKSFSVPNAKKIFQNML